MSGRGQGKNLRTSFGAGRGLGFCSTSLLEFNNELDIEDRIGSNSNSPFQEEMLAHDLSPRHPSDPGGRKRKFGSKFESRVDIVFSLNEAADPTPKEPENGTDMSPSQRVRTKYMHANRQRDRTQQNELKSSQECGTTHEEHLEIPPDDFPLENWRRCATFASPAFCMDLHQCVQDKDKEGAPQTQEEMLLKVLGYKSGYTRGKGAGYSGSVKAKMHEEQQLKIKEQQVQINDIQSQLIANKKEMEEYKIEQQRHMQTIERKLMELMASHRVREVFGDNEDDNIVQ